MLGLERKDGLNNMYKFKLPIGDWSDDGHGKCDWYIIESNKPVQEVREAYFKSVDSTKINLAEELCSEFEDCTLSLEFAEKLESLGIDLTCIKEDSWFDEDMEAWGMDHDSFMEILFQFIQLSDSELILFEVPDNLPIFNSYSYNEYKRHIGHLGYGLFSF